MCQAFWTLDQPFPQFLKAFDKTSAKAQNQIFFPVHLPRDKFFRRAISMARYRKNIVEIKFISNSFGIYPQITLFSVKLLDNFCIISFEMSIFALPK